MTKSGQSGNPHLNTEVIPGRPRRPVVEQPHVVGPAVYVKGDELFDREPKAEPVVRGGGALEVRLVLLRV